MMTADLRRVGGLFMAGLPGLQLDDSSRRLIAEFGVNHFIYFKRNVESAAQLTQLSDDIAACCKAEGLGPPLIAIDQEGGTVSRLPEPFQQFADARLYGDASDAEARLTEYARLCAADLKKIGVTLNFAPVLDVCPKGQGCFMEHRSLGHDPTRVAMLGALVIKELQRHGIAACGKHFPGLGEAVIDPHLHLPVVSDTLEKIRSCDLLPFQAAIRAGVAAIMTSHILYKEVDGDNLATFSRRILTDLLRQELGYTGMVVTDDLEMGAVENDVGVPEAACRAFTAGADLLLICHEHAKVEKAVELLKHKLASGDIAGERFERSFLRIKQVRGCFLANGD